MNPSSVPMPLFPAMAPYRFPEDNEEGSLPVDELLNDADAQMKSQFQLQQDMLLQNDFMHWRTMPEENKESVEGAERTSDGAALEKKAADGANPSKDKGDPEQSAEKSDAVPSFKQEHTEEEEEEDMAASHAPFMFTSAVTLSFLCVFSRISWEILTRLWEVWPQSKVPNRRACWTVMIYLISWYSVGWMERCKAVLGMQCSAMNATLYYVLLFCNPFECNLFILFPTVLTASLFYETNTP